MLGMLVGFYDKYRERIARCKTLKEKSTIINELNRDYDFLIKELKELKAEVESTYRYLINAFEV